MRKVESSGYEKALETINLSGSIHSSFSRTFNVLTEANSFFTVAVNSVFNGPNILKIKRNSFDGINFERGMKVKQIGERLVIAEKVWIDLSTALIYQMERIVFPNKPNRENKLILLNIEKQLSEKLDTVGFFRKTYQNNLEKEQHGVLLKNREALRKAIEDNNCFMIEEEVPRLIGYGNGLTPSGDDFLTGLLLVVNSINYPFVNLKNSLNKTVKGHLSRTNDISQHQLRHAIEGVALEPVMAFLREMYLEKIDDIQLEILLNQVLSIGSSSGSDMLAGILFGLEVTYQKIMNDEN